MAKGAANEEDDWQTILNSGFNAGGIDSVVPNLGNDVIKHADDAIDYGEEDELADDEDLPEEEPPSGNNVIDDGDDELATLMNEGNNNEDAFGNMPLSSRTTQSQFESQLPAYEPSLEERVGSDYAAALMTFDDDWMSGGSAYNLGDGIRNSYSLPPHGASLNDTLSHHDIGSGIGLGLDGSTTISGTVSKDQIKNETSRDLTATREQQDNKEANEKILKQHYPDFVPGGILKLNTIFAPRTAQLMLPRPRVVRPLVPTKVNLEVEADTRVKFKSKNFNIKERPDFTNNRVIKVNPATIAAMSNVSIKNSHEDHLHDTIVRNDKMGEDLFIATVDWDTDSLWNESDESEEKPSRIETLNDSSDSDSSDDEQPLKKIKLNNSIAKTVQKPNSTAKKLLIHTPEVYDSDDEDRFFEGTFNPNKNKVILDMNDSRLLFTQTNYNTSVTQSTQKRIANIPTTDKMLQLRYNISNDRAYDLLKENYQSKVRSMVGNLNIDHSMVALRLQSPHYKVKLSKAQMRSYHRPSFIVKPNTVITFSKIKLRKRKKDKGKPIQVLLNKTTDLTLGDSSQFFLLEYSEEFPLILSNFGMGSKIINYYRKTSAEDQSRPKLPTGETNVLSIQDRSAFWNFGFVEPGKVVPTLYNKMIRAPVFKHEPTSTDFLLIRSTGGGQGQRYFLRSVPHLFTVGQTFPVTPIPGPHSRKVTTASKNRLKMVVFRVLNKSERHRISVRDISAHFPGQNEMQNRQRLKEFMEFQRTGEDQGYWKMKGNEPLPTEDQIRAMITPEDITLLEAMQVGQQHLEDAGYSKTVDDEDEEGDSIEEQLAPWNITRNFINATQGKAMLQLHGEGDPSGSGEGFSFLRTSMKGGFKAMGESVNEKLDKSKFGGHSYNVAMQQKAYDDEISRIWYTQARSLSNPSTEHLTYDETEAKPSTDAANYVTKAPNNNGDEDADSVYSQNTNQGSNKVLKITRFVRDENGTVQRKVETITEPNIIRAYVKRRQDIEDSLIGYVFFFKLFLLNLFTNFSF